MILFLIIGTAFAEVVVVVCCGGVVAVVSYDIDNVLLMILHLPRVHIHKCSTIWLLYFLQCFYSSCCGCCICCYCLFLLILGVHVSSI